MENVPKIVRTRLLRFSPKEHPGADLLTAFAEQSLGAAEREHVILHLSQCGECREVVALSLPASEVSLAPQVMRPTRSAWFGWPAIRWSIAAAGLLLIASFGVLRYEYRRPQKEILMTASVNRQAGSVDARNAEVDATPQAKKDAPESARAPGQSESLQNPVPPYQPPSLPSSRSAPRPSVAGSSSGTDAGLASGYSGGMGAGAYRQRTAPHAAVSRQTEIESSSPAADASASSPASRQAPQDQTPIDRPAVAQNQIPLQLQEQRNSDVVKAKDPAALPASSPALSLGSTVRWSISSAGELQRSFNDGAAWEVVAVTASTKSTRRMLSRATGQDSLYKANPAKENSAVFRTVSASGAEVWAGGSGALLVHSTDAGNHWVQVVPQDSNARLTGDILAIEFTNLQDIKISTSTNEVWISDGRGQNWRKQ